MFLSTVRSHLTITKWRVNGQSVSASSECSVVGTCPQCPANIVKMYPSTNVSKINQSCEPIHRYACVSLHCISTIIGAFVKYTSRVTAPLNKYVGTQGNVSNVVCQAESVYQSCSCRLFLRACVLDSYAIAKIEMAEAWRSKHSNLRLSISLSQNLVNIMEWGGGQAQ
jgi:hypothetical protein